MRVDVVSIFPEYLAPLELSLIGKARQDGILDLRVRDLREFTTDRHRTVDDSPYGGGAGMVMKAEPWAQALAALIEPFPAPDTSADSLRSEPSTATPETSAESLPIEPGPAEPEPAVAQHLYAGAAPSAAGAARPTLLVPSPAGEVFDQAMAHELATENHLVFACGRYEGIDERVLDWAEDHFTVRPVSLGDYVLNGGEVAVLAMVEAIGRLLPGVVGNPESLVEESHADGLLEYPVYTKPSTWRDRPIPEILLSGNHAKIAAYRREEQLRRTAVRRPDLVERLDPATLSKHDFATLAGLGYAVKDGKVRAQEAPPSP